MSELILRTTLVTTVQVHEVPVYLVDRDDLDFYGENTPPDQEDCRLLYSHSFVGIPKDAPDLVLNGPDPEGGLLDEATGTVENLRKIGPGRPEINFDLFALRR